jgi:hypothetical protein
MQSNTRNDTLDVQSTESKNNNASAALVFPVTSSESRRRWQTTLQIPMSFRKSKDDITRLRRLNADAEETDVARYWERRLRKDAVNLTLPDERFERAYYASLAYLLIGLDKGNSHTNNNAQQLIKAFITSNFNVLAKTILTNILQEEAQREKEPEKNISMLSVYYRFTNDKQFILSWWNMLKDMSEKIKVLSIERFGKEISTDGVQFEIGLEQALRDASFLASKLDEWNESKRLKQSADDLSKNIKLLLNDMMKKNPDKIEYLEPSWMFSKEKNLRQKLYHSLIENKTQQNDSDYFDGKFSSVAFHFAEDLVLCLGREEVLTIMQHYITHQAFSETFAWADEIDTPSVGSHIVKMPSLAAASNYINALRTMLLYEEKEQLILCAGIPKEWLQAGEKIQTENMPTHWGTMSYTILVGKDGKKITFKLSGDVEPPDGFILRLPFIEDEIERATINRRETSVEESGDIELEPGTRSVSITLKKALSK